MRGCVNSESVKDELWLGLVWYLLYSLKARASLRLDKKMKKKIDCNKAGVHNFFLFLFLSCWLTLECYLTDQVKVCFLLQICLNNLFGLIWCWFMNMGECRHSVNLVIFILIWVDIIRQENMQKQFHSMSVFMMIEVKMSGSQE